MRFALVLAFCAVALCGPLRPASGEDAAAAGPRRLCVSGVYPHLAFYNGGGECGIGGIVPWAGKLWAITYPPHQPKGGPDKLYEIDEQLNVTIRPESVGGTHACRMIHRESNQLLIGPYFIDAQGKVRAADLEKLTGRLTAIARHLTDPAQRAYFFDMEGAIYDVNVRTLDVKLLFEKPVPGWHGKGGYTSQGRLVISNNGESAVGGKKHNFFADWDPRDPEAAGALAEWDGKEWRVVERRQFTEVTGPGGIHGAPKDDSPLWATGWDRRSVILKLLDGGRWSAFRLPKASHCFDPKHGWYTEWPRIREIGPDRLLMTMHGMIFDFPRTFSAANTAGIRPACSLLRYVTDFCDWNGKLVVSSDDTSAMKNPLAGQSQSNMWFGEYAALKDFGPRAGWGGPWLEDAVKAGEPSAPFLVAGFDQRCLHLAVGGGRAASAGSAGTIHRCTGSLLLTEVPPALAGLARVTIARGDFHKPAPGYAFTVNQDVTVYLLVDDRPRPQPGLGAGWEKTGLKAAWGERTDSVYKRAFKAGRVEIPGHPAEHKPGDYGVPHLCFVQPAAEGAGKLAISDLPAGLGAQVGEGDPGTDRTSGLSPNSPGAPVTFTLEVDARGDGKWTEHKRVAVPDGGYQFHILPPDLQAQWIRLKADRDGVATAYFHFSGNSGDTILFSRRPEKSDGVPRIPGAALFAGLADVTDTSLCAGLIRPAGHNRNLQFLALSGKGPPDADEGAYFEVDERLQFVRPEASRAEEVKKVCKIEPEFEVDAASAILKFKGQRYRFPKGAAQYDKPFAWGWPRTIREVESERYLVNLHGTFYEMPRDEGLPLLKPVCSHRKQIMDFCTWRGLLVISGTKTGAKPDGQYFGDGAAGLWFGGVDDLWRLGKPVGQGGPWLRTAVAAGEPSDPYLMTGFDRKSVQLSHDAAGEVVFTLEVDVTHHGWEKCQEFKVPAGQTVTHVFPEGYSAHWVRVKAGTSCQATALFVYE